MLRDLHLLQCTPHTMCSGARGTPGQVLIPVTQLGSVSRQPRRMSCNVGAACALRERPHPGSLGTWASSEPPAGPTLPELELGCAPRQSGARDHLPA